MPFLATAPEKKPLRAAHALARKGKWDAAIPLYQQAVELAPNTYTIWEWLGYALLATEQYSDAAAAYRRACDLNPDGLRRGRAFPYLNLVNCYLNAEQPGEAAGIVARMLETAPDNADSWICQGVVHRTFKRYPEAEKAFQQALNLAPHNAMAMRELARFYMQNAHDYARALEVLDHLLSKWPLDARAWNLKGQTLLRCEAIQDAKDTFERSLAIASADNDQLGNRSYRGLCMFRLGKFSEALNDFDQGESSINGRFLAYNGRGVIMSRIERPLDALMWYEAALSLLPSTAVQTNKAETLARLGRLDEAEAILDKLLAEEYDAMGAWAVRGIVATYQGRHDEALAAFNRSLALNPRYATNYVEFARLLLVLSDANHARSVIERALALDPNDAGAWQVKGQLLWALGMPEEAQAAEKQGSALLTNQQAQVDAWLQAREQRGEPAGPR